MKNQTVISLVEEYRELLIEFYESRIAYHNAINLNASGDLIDDLLNVHREKRLSAYRFKNAIEIVFENEGIIGDIREYKSLCRRDFYLGDFTANSSAIDFVKTLKIEKTFLA